jgi:hypothetical protein
VYIAVQVVSSAGMMSCCAVLTLTGACHGFKRLARAGPVFWRRMQHVVGAWTT